MFVFLDDVRTAPKDAVLCRTAKEAIAIIDTGKVTLISFDHDLGTKISGYDVAKHIEVAVMKGKIACPEWAIHSANPVGRGNIEAAMHSAERFAQ